MPRRAAAAVGLALGALTAAAYSTTIFLPFDGDGATSVGLYIHHSGFRRLFHLNFADSNHLLFTVAEKLIYVTSGHNNGEAILRILPIAAGAGAVALLTTALAIRLGAPAAVAGGLMLGANPLFALEARAIRGYSLLTLLAIASSLVMVDLRRKANPSGRNGALYVLLAAAGVATHVYMLFVIALQAIYVVTRRRPTWRWTALFAVAVVAGLLPYTLMLHQMISGSGGRRFHRQFPQLLAKDLLGGTSVAVIISAALVAAALIVRPRREWLTVGGSFLALLVAMWLIWQPFGLATRFFIWALPALVATAALAVARWPRIALPAVVVLVAAEAWSQAPHWNRPEFAEKAAAAIVHQQHQLGATVCSLGFGGGPLSGYVRGQFLDLSSDTTGIKRCDHVVVVTRGILPRRTFTLLGNKFQYRRVIGGAWKEPTIIYSRSPLPGSVLNATYQQPRRRHGDRGGGVGA